MKKSLLLALALIISGLVTNAQNTELALKIIKNGQPITDTLDNGQVVTLDTSSDDAEQENDEMDALYDDDLDAGWEGEPDDQNILTTGLRFQNVGIPKGATIDSAFLILHSHEGKTADDVARITIVGEAADNAATYDLNTLITDRLETSAFIMWEVAEKWEIWEPYSTPDLKEIIQEIVDRGGWEYGNSMAIMLKGENQGPSTVENAREFESFENIADPEDGGDGQNHPERIPMLKVYYSFPSTVFEVPIQVLGDPITDTLDNGQIVTFDTSSDDAEQENDEMDALYDDDVDAGWEGEPDDQNILVAGFRFRNIDIPKGVNIDSAFIILHSHEGKTSEDVARITIVGEASDDAATYDLESLITDRPQTVASIMWEVAEDWEIWEPYRTPNISTIIQEVIDREVWATGNPIAIMMLGENQGPSIVENAREFESFENIADPEDGGDGQNHPERRPKLVVYYSGSSSIGEMNDGYRYLTVYPNPAQEEVHILLESEETAEISVYNQVGKLVIARQTENTAKATIRLNELPKGVYLIKAVQEQTVYTQKLIVR